jgi:hypothetical protein
MIFTSDNALKRMSSGEETHDANLALFNDLDRLVVCKTGSSGMIPPTLVANSLIPTTDCFKLGCKSVKALFGVRTALHSQGSLMGVDKFLKTWAPAKSCRLAAAVLALRSSTSPLFQRMDMIATLTADASAYDRRGDDVPVYVCHKLLHKQNKALRS